MKKNLTNIANLRSGIYEKPDINADILYLQAVHFNGSGKWDRLTIPQLKLNSKIEKHLLTDGDILFAAKGVNNFAAVYNTGIGRAVASSSFIVIKINPDYEKSIQPDYLAWFITHHKQIKLMHQQQLGTTIPSIGMKQLGELEINIPPVVVQQRIVSVHRLREKEKELNNHIEELKDKEFQILLSNATKK